MAKLHPLLPLLVLTLLQQTNAVLFEVRDTTGNIIFEETIGIQLALHELAAGTRFIWNIFTYSDEYKKNVQRVTLSIDNYTGVSYEDKNEIHLNANYILSYPNNVTREFTGLLYSELAYVWQWDTRERYTSSGWIVQGISDFVRLRAGYWHPTWAKPGQGGRWDESSDVTARFLDYCNDIRHDFVAKLNKLMMRGYKDEYFTRLFNKPIHQAWEEYKAAY